MDRDNPHDIFQQDGAAHSFDVVIRGYDRSQVHDVVDRLDGELRVALADKDASAARAEELASHLAGVQAEVDSLRQKAASAAAPNFESMGARISHMLKLAEEEANDIRRIAEQDHTRSRAELESITQESARLRGEAQDGARQLTEEAQAQASRLSEEAQDAAAKTVGAAQAEADALGERTRAAAEQAEQDSKARVAKVEEDFQLAQKARRAEAARVEQERDQSSRRDAQNRIAQAQHKSDQMVGAAVQRVSDLEAQRSELHSRLTQVRELLNGLPDIGTATVTEPNSEQEAATSSGSQSGQSKSPTEAPEDDATTDPVEQPAPAQTEPAVDMPTDVQASPPPPPAGPGAPRWPVNTPTRAIPIPRQG